MANIELVIKIPEALYNNIQEGCGIYPYRLVYDAIVNGIPLPKGHGRLIDAEHFVEEHPLAFVRDVINTASTIIEADKADQ